MNFGRVERALEALVDDLERLLVGPLALGLHGLRQRLQLAAERPHVVQLDVLLHQAVELFGRVQEVRQRLVPEPELDQLPADQEVAAHQLDVAVEADAGVAWAAVGEVGLAAFGGIVGGAASLVPALPCAGLVLASWAMAPPAIEAPASVAAPMPTHILRVSFAMWSLLGSAGPFLHGCVYT